MRAKEFIAESVDEKEKLDGLEHNPLATEIYRLIRGGNTVIWRPDGWNTTTAFIRTMKPTDGKRKRKMTTEGVFETNLYGTSEMKYTYIPYKSLAEVRALDPKQKSGRWKSKRILVQPDTHTKYEIIQDTDLGENVYKLVKID